MQEKKFGFWDKATTITRYLAVMFMTLWFVNIGQLGQYYYLGLFLVVLLCNLYAYYSMKVTVEDEIKRRLKIDRDK